MTWPTPVAALWNELEVARADLLREVVGLSQRQADWRPGERDWSVGEVLHHLTMAEIATGKLTTKLTKDAAAGGAAAVVPHDLTEFAAPPLSPPGPAEAPEVVWPERGRAVDELLATLTATRERSRQSMDRLAASDPRTLRFKHLRLGDMDLGQWWRLHADHERTHLQQVREIKRAPGFPA